MLRQNLQENEKVSPKRSLLHETKKGFEEQGDQIMSKLRGTISDFYDKRSKTISKEYDIEMVMKVSDFVFLPLHEESENHFSMSLLAKMELNGLSEVVSATMSMCYTKKTIPQVVVRGSKDDLNGQGLFALNGQRSCSKLTNSCSGVTSLS